MASNVLNAVVLGSVYTLFALGLTLAWGVLNVLNLAHGAIFMFSAFCGYLITQHHALSIWIVLPAGMLVGGLIAAALEVLAFAPIRKRNPDATEAEMAMLIASVGAGAILVAVVQNVTHNEPKGINDATFPVHNYDILGLEVSNIKLLIIVLAIVLSVALALFVQRSRVGRALRALSHDPYTCGLLGISANRLALTTLFVGGALAGVAGVLLAVYQNAISPSMGDPFLLKAFAVIVLGGVGSVWGAMAGAYLLAGVETLAIVYSTGTVRDAIAFALIILLLLLRPQGLFARRTWQRA